VNRKDPSVERTRFPGNDVARRKGLLQCLVELLVQAHPPALGLEKNRFHAQAPTAAQRKMRFDFLSLAQPEQRGTERGGDRQMDLPGGFLRVHELHGRAHTRRFIHIGDARIHRDHVRGHLGCRHNGRARKRALQRGMAAEEPQKRPVRFGDDQGVLHSGRSARLNRRSPAPRTPTAKCSALTFPGPINRSAKGRAHRMAPVSAAPLLASR